MIESAPYIADFGPLALRADASSRSVVLASTPGMAAALNRYSIFASWPLALLDASRARGLILLSFLDSGTPDAKFGSFNEATRAALGLLAPFETPHPPWPVDHRPFTGGLIGFLSYEAGARFDQMPSRDSGLPMPSLWFGLYPAFYLADHHRREGWWIAREPNQGFDFDPRRSLDRIKAVVVEALGGSHPEPAHGDMPEGLDSGAADWREAWEPSLDGLAYRRAVEKILHYLACGDIYQANLTVRHSRTFEGNPARVFAGLLRANPAPFAAFLSTEDWAVMSSSPELLLDLRSGGEIETRPIKGTVERPGAAAAGLDRESARRLIVSAKDRAEHLMIVDLERNDLGRVCRYGSVHVQTLMGLESYTGLHHLVSSVRGRLRPGLGPTDAIGAIFPGGSITGAPKIRAMEIIHELEPVARGVYCGAMGWITPEGEARFNLPIRTMTACAGRLDLHVGGGIVIDSDPEAEADECRVKGAAMARAVEMALDRSHPPRIAAR